MIYLYWNLLRESNWFWLGADKLDFIHLGTHMFVAEFKISKTQFFSKSPNHRIHSPSISMVRFRLWIEGMLGNPPSFWSIRGFRFECWCAARKLRPLENQCRLKLSKRDRDVVINFNTLKSHAWNPPILLCHSLS